MNRLFTLLLFTIITSPAFSQKDSCDCRDFGFPNFTFGGNYLLDSSYFIPHYRKGSTTPYSGVCTSYSYDGKLLTRTFLQKGYIVGMTKWDVETGNVYFEMDGHRHDSVLYVTKSISHGMPSYDFTQDIFYSKGGRVYMQERWYNSPYPFPWKTQTYKFYMPGDSATLTWRNVSKYPLIEGCYTGLVLSGAYREYGGNDRKTVVTRGQYEEGKREGDWMHYAPDGKMLLKKETFYHDKNTGSYAEFYPDGKKKVEGNYRNGGVKVGDWKEWYSNGQPSLIASYCQQPGWYGLKDGEYLEYYEDGKLKTKFHFTHGRYTGSEQTWFQNGQQAEKRFYTDSGIAEGKQSEWYANGKLRCLIDVHNGMVASPLKEFYDNGQLKRELIPSSPAETGTWYNLLDSLHDKIAQYGRFFTGEKKEYNEAGVLLSDEKHLNGAKEGVCTYYYTSGKTERIEHYAKGVLNGEQKTFSTDKVLLSDLSFKDGQWDSICKWYFPDGKLWREFSYSGKMKVAPDYWVSFSTRNGLCREWDKKGNLVYRQEFDHGKLTGKGVQVAVPVGFNMDSVTSLFKNDAVKILSQRRVSPLLRQQDSMMTNEKILNDLLAIYRFMPAEIDSARLVHFAASYSDSAAYSTADPFNHTQTRIECSPAKNWTEYTYYLFWQGTIPYPHYFHYRSQYPDYLYKSYHFRVYADGSVDLLNYDKTPQVFEPHFPTL